MKKLLLSLLAAGMVSGAASATETWTLTKANKVYEVDTIYHATVGPGTTYTELSMKGEYLERVFYLTINLNNRYNDVVALKAGDNRVARQTVPVIAQNHDVAGEVSYFAGVNSDFFNMSSPYYTNGMSVCEGLLQSTQNAAPWNHWILDSDGEQHIVSSLTYSPYATLPDGAGSFYFIMNQRLGTNEMHLYQYDTEIGGTQTTAQKQKNWNETTVQVSYGSECIIAPVNGKFPIPVGSTEWEVISTPTAAGSKIQTTIPTNGYVLAGNGTAATAVAKLKVGDKITTKFNFKADGTAIATPKQVSGGNNILLKDGVHIDINASNAPRTFIGYDKSSSKCILMAIDGRQDGWSAGVYYRLGAAIMEKVGCYNALEFDGGGSTTMYVKPLGGTTNKPSDGALRQVACGVYAAAKCPNDWNVTKIEVKQKNIKLTPGETFTPHVYGYNRYGVMIDNNVTGYTLEAPATLGTVSNDGKSVTAHGAGYQVLTVKYGQLTLKVPVKLPGDAGVENVSIDESESTADQPAEYYNLSGIRIAEPTGGLYIVRRGSSTTKEYIR